MNNVLVVGGTYFIGRLFVQELVKTAQYKIFVLNRGNVPLNEESVTELTCDRNNPLQLKRTLENHSFHTVIDFCAYAPEQVTTLFQALPREEFRHYIFISTASVYAPTHDLAAREDAEKVNAPQPELGPAANYGFDKWRAEYASMAQARRAGIDYTHLRPAIVYGMYNYAPRESYFFDLIHGGDPVILPDNDLARFSFVSVWDVSRALQICMENPTARNQSYNLAAPEAVTYTRFVESLGQAMNREVSITRMPAAEIDSKGIPLPFPLESSLLYSGEKIQRELGFEYTPLDSGMQATWEWYSRTQIPQQG